MSTREALRHLAAALSALADATDLIVEWGVGAGEGLTPGLRDSVARRARSSLFTCRRELHDAAAVLDEPDEPHDRESGGALARFWRWLFGR